VSVALLLLRGVDRVDSPSMLWRCGGDMASCVRLEEINLAHLVKSHITESKRVMESILDAAFVPFRTSQFELQ
jgi:hypothetical protein